MDFRVVARRRLPQAMIDLDVYKTYIVVGWPLSEDSWVGQTSVGRPTDVIFSAAILDPR